MRTLALLIALTCGCAAISSPVPPFMSVTSKEPLSGTGDKSPDSVESQSIKPEAVSQLASGTRIRVIRESIEGEHTVMIGTVLKADTSGLALMNCKTASRDHITVKSTFGDMSMGLFAPRPFEVRHLPVEWVPMRDVVEAKLISDASEEHPDHGAGIQMDDERYLDYRYPNKDLATYEFRDLQW